MAVTWFIETLYADLKYIENRAVCLQTVHVLFTTCSIYIYNKLSVYENYINYYILHLRWDVYIIITIWCNVYMSLYILTKCYMEYNNGCNLPYVINYMIHLQFHHLTDCFENSPFTFVKTWALRIIKLRMEISSVLWCGTRITDTLVMLEKCIW